MPFSQRPPPKVIIACHIHHELYPENLVIPLSGDTQGFPGFLQLEAALG